MERFIWKNQSVQPFYVFDGKYIVHFWDDGISIGHVKGDYKDVNTKTSPIGSPHIYPKALSQETYKNLVLKDRLPIEITMKGENLGGTKLTSGYSEVDMGAYSRNIIQQTTTIKLTKSELTFTFYILTTAVDPQSVHGELIEEHKKPQEYLFEFPFPIDIVPEILNLTQREIRSFTKIVDKLNA